ncbi:MAG TPA: ankyrin repeat domain-containing protein [Gemmatimonadaceae bacterium]|nr:ankyrin repeat domain-containing protein [Gemmatimonadaceae bacterium]
MSSRGLDDAVAAFLSAAQEQDRVRASQLVEADPQLAEESLHAAAVLGIAHTVRRLIAADPSHVSARIGEPAGDPLLFLCFSPFHGESAERDGGLVETARVLIEAGADPNTRDGQYGVPALYAVTGVRSVLPIARLLLDFGANPTDGESVFHAAERFHVDALELLLSAGADLNHTGEWGNTPLYYLLRWWDVESEPRVKKGLQWLLDHGSDPGVPCGKERENSLHVAARRGQSVYVVRLLLEHGADVHARRGDGMSAWLLARRGGYVEIASLLEGAGATPEPLSPLDLLLAACSSGDVDTARRLTSPELLSGLAAEDRTLLPEAAAAGRVATVMACLAAGLDVNTTDTSGATALHQAAINGNAELVRELLEAGADVRIKDSEHSSTPLGWACFGADYVAEKEGDYEDCVRGLLEAGATVTADEHQPEHAGVRAVLRESTQP